MIARRGVTSPAELVAEAEANQGLVARTALRMPLQALRDYGCGKIFTDEGMSGNAVIKPAYTAMLAHARAGDEP